jgi:hypothetical protein
MVDDLKQYMTNLLYYAHIEAQTMNSDEFDKWVEEMIELIDGFFKSNQPNMKELITSDKTKKTALIFKCKCGAKFISNEYKPGQMLPSHGTYHSAIDKCPVCNETVKGGRIYDPIPGSEEHKKWYG